MCVMLISPRMRERVQRIERSTVFFLKNKKKTTPYCIGGVDIDLCDHTLMYIHIYVNVYTAAV